MRKPVRPMDVHPRESWFTNVENEPVGMLARPRVRVIKNGLLQHAAAGRMMAGRVKELGDVEIE